jgi:hypothetical protein
MLRARYFGIIDPYTSWFDQHSRLSDSDGLADLLMPGALALETLAISVGLVSVGIGAPNTEFKN